MPIAKFPFSVAESLRRPKRFHRARACALCGVKPVRIAEKSS